MRKQLELANDTALELAGSEDAVLRALEGHLDCSVFLRGNVLTLDGPEEAVRAGEEVVRELADLVAQGHQIVPGTIAAVTSALDQHEEPARILGHGVGAVGDEEPAVAGRADGHDPVGNRSHQGHEVAPAQLRDREQGVVTAQPLQALVVPAHPLRTREILLLED